MNDELPRIQEQVYYGHINSRTDILGKFLSENGISRYNPQVNHLNIFVACYLFLMVINNIIHTSYLNVHVDHF